MCDINKAIQFVLLEEDSTLSNQVEKVPGDAGGATRLGIASKAHPELIKTGFFSTMSKSDAMETAINVYTNEYATPLKLEAIEDQSLANAVLSLGVNAGVGTALDLLQKSKNNLCLFAVLACTHYVAIVLDHPGDIKFLHGWINRVNGWLGMGK